MTALKPRRGSWYARVLMSSDKTFFTNAPIRNFYLRT